MTTPVLPKEQLPEFPHYPHYPQIRGTVRDTSSLSTPTATTPVEWGPQFLGFSLLEWGLMIFGATLVAIVLISCYDYMSGNRSRNRRGRKPAGNRVEEAFDVEIGDVRDRKNPHHSMDGFRPLQVSDTDAFLKEIVDPDYIYSPGQLQLPGTIPATEAVKAAPELPTSDALTKTLDTELPAKYKKHGGFDSPSRLSMIMEGGSSVTSSPAHKGWSMPPSVQSLAMGTMSPQHQQQDVQQQQQPLLSDPALVQQPSLSPPPTTFAMAPTPPPPQPSPAPSTTQQSMAPHPPATLLSMMMPPPGPVTPFTNFGFGPTSMIVDPAPQQPSTPKTQDLQDRKHLLSYLNTTPPSENPPPRNSRRQAYKPVSETILEMPPQPQEPAWMQRGARSGPFKVLLRKAPGATTLGAQIDEDFNVMALPITEIFDVSPEARLPGGLIYWYNQENPFAPIVPGDVIIDINGIVATYPTPDSVRGNCRGHTILMDEIKRSYVLELTIMPKHLLHMLNSIGQPKY